MKYIEKDLCGPRHDGKIAICRGCGHLSTEHYKDSWQWATQQKVQDCSLHEKPCFTFNEGDRLDSTGEKMWLLTDEFGFALYEARKMKVDKDA